MVEDPDAIREAIDETRSDMAETIDALGQKADVKARTANKVDETKEQVKAKATELGQRAGQAVPEQARPAVASAVDQAKSATTKAAVTAQQRPAVAAAIGAGALFLLVVRRRHRRRRESC